MQMPEAWDCVSAENAVPLHPQIINKKMRIRYEEFSEKNNRNCFNHAFQ